jgi:membrane-bound metal-dependent hydrolase YbcI (DUF457 family)
MAMFREHIAIGAIVAAVGVAVCYFYALVTDPLLLVILFLVTTVASFLPDLDSDSGLPFHLIFGTFTVFCTGVALYYTLDAGYGDWRVLLGVPLAAMLFTWIVLGGIFKHFTRHRGMMHSIPAMLIAGLATLIIARDLGQGEIVSTVLAAAVGAGYLSHLVLDELYSGINLDGSIFHPTRALGTALKFFSSSKGANLFTYAILTVLAYTAFG